MDLSEVGALYIFRPLTTYTSHEKILQKCRKLKKEYEDTPANPNYKESIPQIRDYWDEFQEQLDQNGKWWGSRWSRYKITFADLERAVRQNEFKLSFYRNLLIIKFDQHASIALKEALFYKALETELEVVPE
ncbi:MAG: hypothetical protein EOP06_06195 [Proteobacteria bacterium]|nr:MAG: hypothetical protein EOP06_06195 [Pseudomonadota bacterium]